MNSRERVLAATSHVQPDRAPMDFGGTSLSSCTAGFLAKTRAALGYSLPRDRDEDETWVDESISRYLGVDLRWVPFQPPLAVLKDLDPAGYQRIKSLKEKAKAAERKDIKNPDVRQEFPLAGASLEDVRRLKPELLEPDPYMDWLTGLAKGYQAAGYATTYTIDCGFFEKGCWMRGYDTFAMDLVENPDLVRTLFDLWLKEKLRRLEILVKPLAPYIDIFCFGDDFGLQLGPFMSPAVFREMIKPYFTELYGRLHAMAPNSKIFHHSCGSVATLLGDLADMGVDILNPIQPLATGMEPENLKARGGSRLCFHGGIDLQKLLPFGTPGEVAAEVRRRISILGQGGGYICAAAHSLPEDVPLENVLALFSAPGKGA